MGNALPCFKKRLPSPASTPGRQGSLDVPQGQASHAPPIAPPAFPLSAQQPLASSRDAGSGRQDDATAAGVKRQPVPSPAPALAALEVDDALAAGRTSQAGRADSRGEEAAPTSAAPRVIGRIAMPEHVRLAMSGADSRSQAGGMSTSPEAQSTSEAVLDTGSSNFAGNSAKTASELQPLTTPGTLGSSDLSRIQHANHLTSGAAAPFAAPPAVLQPGFSVIDSLVQAKSNYHMDTPTPSEDISTQNSAFSPGNNPSTYVGSTAGGPGSTAAGSTLGHGVPSSGNRSAAMNDSAMTASMGAAVATSGFMFGAPRMKDGKKKRRPKGERGEDSVPEEEAVERALDVGVPGSQSTTTDTNMSANTGFTGSASTLAATSSVPVPGPAAGLQVSVGSNGGSAATAAGSSSARLQHQQVATAASLDPASSPGHSSSHSGAVERLRAGQLSAPDSPVPVAAAAGSRPVNKIVATVSKAISESGSESVSGSGGGLHGSDSQPSGQNGSTTTGGTHGNTSVTAGSSSLAPGSTFPASSSALPGVAGGSSAALLPGSAGQDHGSLFSGGSGLKPIGGKGSKDVSAKGSGAGAALEVVESSDDDHSSPRSDSGHLNILEPPVGSDVENVLTLVCNIFQLPVSLVAAYRSSNIFIRSSALRLSDDSDWRTSLAEWSLSGCTDLQDVLIIEDTRKDPLSKNLHCVQHDPRVLFFMVSPLRASNGELLGTLCMADFKPRQLDPANLLIINNLQSLVIRQLERDVALAEERVATARATERLQQDMMRTLDHFEKCIMFIDTSQKGWVVLYTNLAWERITGVPREHVMNRPMQDAFQGRTAAPYKWGQWDARLNAKEEFTIDNVAIRLKPDKHVRLHLRLATREGVAESIIATGLPDFVQLRGTAEDNYFVLVEEEMAGVPQNVYEALAKHMEKVPGLELSHVLGRGGFGSVYYGTWNGLPVAVKMIENKLAKTNTDGVSLEALMGQELDHPNIVKTIKYVQRQPKGSSHNAPIGSNGSGNPLGSNNRNHTSRSPGVLPTSNMATSMQPGLHSMTSAQMAAAEMLTSASGMQGLPMVMPGSSEGRLTVAAMQAAITAAATRAGTTTTTTQDPATAAMQQLRRAASNVGAQGDAVTAADIPTIPSGSNAGPASSVSTSDTVVGGGDEPGAPANVLSSSSSSAIVTPSVSVAHGIAPTQPAAMPPAVVVPPIPGPNSRNRYSMPPGGLQPVPELQASVMDLTGPQGAAGGAMGDAALGLVHNSLPFSLIQSGDPMVSRGSRSPVSSGDPTAHGTGSTSSDDQGEVWLIMEYCDRGSLQDGLDDGLLKLTTTSGETLKETHLPQMVATAWEVASALAYLHTKGIVHGDLTAWNVMLTTNLTPEADRTARGFTAKVADFGLSRTMDVRSKIKTRTYGTITHMPPETLISGIISKAADVFSFGVLLWQMYTGMKPWAGMNHGQIIYNVGMKNVQLLFPPGTPPAIADLSSACTASDPTKRPTFEEIMQRLSVIKDALGA